MRLAMRNWMMGLLLVSPITLVGACSASTESNGFGGWGPTGSATGTGGQAGSSSTVTSGVGGGFGFDAGMTSGSGTPCTPTPAGDEDNDGFTTMQGDCNDCDANVNPNAIDVPTAPGQAVIDENCDGTPDNYMAELCDDMLAVDDADPLSAARAVDLCKMSSGPNDWGVVSAQWVLPDGSPPPPLSIPVFDLGHGMLTAFGPNVNVQKGARMLALSSGTARQPNDPGYSAVGGFDKGYISGHPQGFPKESPACLGVITGEPHDGTGVEIVIRAPSNAHGFSFNFDFYTYEWPGFVCSTFNDFFVALLSPKPPTQMDGNISFDSQGNPVSVNNAFVEVCGCFGNPPNPCYAGTKTFTCALGNIELIGTGFGFDTAFEDHGATSWLMTKAPIDPGGEITIRWAVYDSGDGILDSTTLIDNWQWIVEPGTTVETDPIPDPH
jgi:hypothetical protein